MGYTDPNGVSNPTTGATITAAWGDIARDQIVWLAGDAASSNPKPICIVYSFLGSSQSIANSTLTALTGLNAEQVDTANMWALSPNPSRITIPVTGRYSFGAACVFAANATGVRELRVRLNGGGGAPANVARTTTPAASGADIAMNVSGFATLQAGDYLEPVVFQSSGGALNVLYELGLSQTFWCRWEGHA